MSEKKVIEKTESTQADLKRALEQNPHLPHLSYIQALEQTAGRGRQGNAWISRPGNLYLSVLFCMADADPSATKNLTWMPLWVGSQVRKALIELGWPATELQLKWPNDLYYRESAKFGGIICEKVQQNLVIGLGINVAHSPQGGLLDGRAVTSLVEMGMGASNAETKRRGSSEPVRHSITLDQLRDAILVQLGKSFDLSALKLDLHSYLIPKIGAEVHWVNQLEGNARRSGIVVGLGGFGELQVAVDDQIVQLFSEEVSLKKI